MVKAKSVGVKKSKVGTPAVEKETSVATQVVEVVEEAKTEDQAEIEDISTSEAGIEGEDKAVDDQSEVKKEEEAPVSEVVSSVLHEKNREVVEEIFTHKNIHISDEIVSESKGNMASVYWWAIALISCVVTIGGILIYINSKDKVKFDIPFNFAKPTPTVQPTPTVTPTPLDKTKLKVKVLNGGGVAGAAGKMKSLLEEKGYIVMGTGNADNYDYEETVIQVKEEMKNIIDLLKPDLGKIYKVASEVATLDIDAESDVVVIVGKK